MPAVVVTLGIVSLLTDISSESVAAILPLYLTAVLGLSTIAYGFVDGLYQGVSALVRIGGGWAADRGGHPKWVAFVGYGLSARRPASACCSPPASAAITAVVTADRIGKGMRTAPRDAMIAAATPADRLGRAFGVHRTLDTIGAAHRPAARVRDPVVRSPTATTPCWSSRWPSRSSAWLAARPARAGAGAGPRPERDRTGTPTPFRWRTLADPRLARLLVVAGVLGLLTVGDGFIYLALLDRGGFAAHWFPLLYVGTNIAYLSLARPARPAGRPGRPGPGPRRRPRRPGRRLPLRGRRRSPVPLATLLALLLLGTFYAATDGVIAALAGRLVAGRRRGPAASPRPRPSSRRADGRPRPGSGCSGSSSGPQPRAGRRSALRCSLALPVALRAARAVWTARRGGVR